MDGIGGHIFDGLVKTFLVIIGIIVAVVFLVTKSCSYDSGYEKGVKDAAEKKIIYKKTVDSTMIIQ
jgi:hypothetical protein